jgi:hypothetical protein
VEVRGFLISTAGRTKENKFNVQTSVGKVKAGIFWDKEETLLLKFLAMPQ